MNIDYEENFGFLSNVYSLFEKAIGDVSDEEKLEVINYYISKGAHFNGI